MFRAYFLRSQNNTDFLFSLLLSFEFPTTVVLIPNNNLLLLSVEKLKLGIVQFMFTKYAFWG